METVVPTDWRRMAGKASTETSHTSMLQFARINAPSPIQSGSYNIPSRPRGISQQSVPAVQRTYFEVLSFSNAVTKSIQTLLQKGRSLPHKTPIRTAAAGVETIPRNPAITYIKTSPPFSPDSQRKH